MLHYAWISRDCSNAVVEYRTDLDGEAVYEYEVNLARRTRWRRKDLEQLHELLGRVLKATEPTTPDEVAS